MLGLLSTLESEEFEKFEKVAGWTVVNTRAPDGAKKNFYRECRSRSINEVGLRKAGLKRMRGSNILKGLKTR